MQSKNSSLKVEISKRITSNFLLGGLVALSICFSLIFWYSHYSKVDEWLSLTDQITSNIEVLEKSIDDSLHTAFNGINTEFNYVKLPTRENMLSLRGKYRVSNVYKVNPQGNVVEVTNSSILENPDFFKSFSIFDLCPDYRSMIGSKVRILTPFVWLRDFSLPSKFLMGWNKEHNFILEVSADYQKLAEFIKKIVETNEAIKSLSIVNPAGNILSEYGVEKPRTNIGFVPRWLDFKTNIHLPTFTYVIAKSFGELHYNCDALDRQYYNDKSKYFYTINIEFDYLTLIEPFLFFITLFLAIVVLMIVLLKKHIGKTIDQEILDPIQSIDKKIKGRLSQILVLKSNNEIENLNKAVETLFEQLNSTLNDISSNEIQNLKSKSHDIRPHIRILQRTLLSVSICIPEDQKETIKNSLSRISEISNDFDRISQRINTLKGNDLNSTFVPEALEDSIIAMQSKRVQFEFKTNYNEFARINPLEFKSFVERVINNALEVHDGLVFVSFVTIGSKVILKIQDEGPGFRKDIIYSLEILKKPEKAKGHGFGLVHARSKLINIGGNLFVENNKTGALVTMLIPTTKTPDWFTNSIHLDGRTPVIVDDDDKFAKVYSKYFEKFLYFQTYDELLIWFKMNAQQKANYLFLVDYTFLNATDGETGVSIINDLDIADQSILVTSSTSDALEKRDSKIKILPKYLVIKGEVKIEY